MLQDQATAVGCAVARYTLVSNGWKTTLLACNYAWTNILNVAVYTKGLPASQCASVDSTYTSLCIPVPTTIATTTSTTPLITTASTTDYCAICANHVACNNTGNWYAICPTDATLVVLPTDVRDAIVDTHNFMRNNVASGNLTGYNSATKMFKMVRFKIN